MDSQDQNSSTPPKMKRQYSDPDFLVIKLKYENYDAFEELVVSHITRHLDLPGTMLSAIRGKFDPKVDKAPGSEKSSMQKFMNKLTSKKKEDKDSEIEISSQVLEQIGQLTVFVNDHLDVEGIFRIPGSANRQAQLITALGTGAYIDFSKSSFKPVDAAAVLKNYLKLLKEPLLIPTKYFDAHLQVANFNRKEQKQKVIECLQLILLLLPTQYRQLLQGIFDLLYQTAKNQKQNKMTAANLSAMFAPHIIWPRHMKAVDLKEKVVPLNEHVAFMIRHSQKIFKAPFYIREAAQKFFPFKDEPTCLSPQMTSTRLVAPSSAVKLRPMKKYLESKDKATNQAMSEMITNAWKNPSSPANKQVLETFNKHEQTIITNSNLTPQKKLLDFKGSSLSIANPAFLKKAVSEEMVKDAKSKGDSLRDSKKRSQSTQLISTAKIAKTFENKEDENRINVSITSITSAPSAGGSS